MSRTEQQDRARRAAEALRNGASVRATARQLGYADRRTLKRSVARHNRRTAVAA